MKFPFVSAVVGTSFRAESAAKVTPGAVVTLQREPENPADPSAVAVRLDGETIGYLPRALAARLVGETWHGLVTEVHHGEGIGIRVRVTGDESAVPASVPTRRGLPQASDTVVRARSGRLLGTLVSVNDGKVRVLTARNTVVIYPADLVETSHMEPA